MYDLVKKLNGLYQGYIWLSDKKEPLILVDELFPGHLKNNSVESFIVEAQLYEKETNISIRMLFVDNVLHTYSYNLYELEKTRFFETEDNKQFVGNRMKEKILLFRQYWIEENDPYCINMKTLKPAELVYVGFGS